MMASPNLYQRLTAEWGLLRHNRRNKSGVVSADAQAFFVIENVFAEDELQHLQTHLLAEAKAVVRSKVEWRRGGATGGHELLHSQLWPSLKFLVGDDFQARVQRATGIRTLQLVPKKDTNRLSLLDYRCEADAAAGDGIDWHVDGSIYLGQRWAGILTLFEETAEDTAKLELKPHGKLATLAKAKVLNSLVLFRGDHVEHRVRPMLPGEHRIVLSLLFSDWPVMTFNPSLLRYQARINRIFYGNSDL